MEETILVGREGDIVRLPADDWKQSLLEAPERISSRLGFMSEDHHQVRYFVVRELPRIGKPIEPAVIADALRLSPSRTAKIIDDLEKRLFFHVRNADGAISWAFPVTVDETPHHLVFSTGERLNAA